MNDVIPLRCECGTVRGRAKDVGSRWGNRALCFCDDCQAFAFYLGRAGDVLDEHGGSDIYQMTPAQIEIEQGNDHLRCMQLSAGGRGLRRWYTACCRTPVGNTPATPQIPFVGIVHSFMDHAAHGMSRDQALGPVRDRVFGKYARGDVSQLDAAQTGSPARMLRLTGWTLLNRLRGLHSPTPFFDAATGQPSAAAHVLSASELEEVVRARDAGA